MASSGEKTLVKSYASTNNIQVGKLTVVLLDLTTEGNFVMSGTANNGPVAGVALESLVPDNQSDYVSGQYVTASGAAWPSGVIPSSAVGREIEVCVGGICEVIAASSLSIGARVVVSASTALTLNGVSTTVQGMVQDVLGLSLSGSSGGSVVYEVGEALRAATNAGDVIRVRLTLNKRPSVSSSGA